MGYKKLDPSGAFDFFVSLGYSRNYPKVAEYFNCEPRSVERLASRDNWQQRAAEIDAAIAEKTREKTQTMLEQLNAEHLKVLRKLRERAFEALETFSFENAKDSVAAIKVSVETERLVSGASTSHSEITVQSQLREMFEGLLERVPEKEPVAAGRFDVDDLGDLELEEPGE